MNRRILVVLALAVGAMAPAAGTAGAFSTQGVGIRLLDAPADRADEARARIYIVDHLRPGARIDRRVEVVNESDRPQTLQLYAGAAAVSGAAFTFGEGSAANELTAWTTIAPSQVTLGAGAKATAMVSIAVPAAASAGERYAVVWAQGQPSSGAGARQVARAGVRVYLSVGEGGEPATSFTVSALTAGRQADGRPAVEATVRNTGGRALELTGELQLKAGPGGLSAGPFPVALGTTIGPGTTAAAVVVLDPEIPAGPWDAQLTLKSGPVAETVSARLTFPAAPATAGPPVAPTPATPAPDATEQPAMVLAGAVTTAAVLAAAGAFALLRRRSKDDVPAPAAPA